MRHLTEKRLHQLRMEERMSQRGKVMLKKEEEEVVEVAVGVVTGLAGDVVEVVVKIGLRSEGAALEAVTDRVDEKAAQEVMTEGVNVVAAVEAKALLKVQVVEVLPEGDQETRDVMKVAVQALKGKKELMWRQRKLVQLNNI